MRKDRDKHESGSFKWTIPSPQGRIFGVAIGVVTVCAAMLPHVLADDTSSGARVGVVVLAIVIVIGVAVRSWWSTQNYDE